jgi:uncharacterized protein (DUF2345 family)
MNKLRQLLAALHTKMAGVAEEDVIELLAAVEEGERQIAAGEYVVLAKESGIYTFTDANGITLTASFHRCSP